MPQPPRPPLPLNPTPQSHSKSHPQSHPHPQPPHYRLTPLHLKLLSTIPTFFALAALCSLRHRARQSLIHHTTPSPNTPYPLHPTITTSPHLLLLFLLFLLPDLLFWLPLFYTVLVLQLGVIYQPDAALERAMAMRSEAERERWRAGWRVAEEEEERMRKERRKRRRLLLVPDVDVGGSGSGSGEWGVVRWGRDADGGAKAVEAVERGRRLTRAGRGEAVRWFA
ncbi:uncharacterized protein BKCO1_5100042 [Diplodia corticola]|uniref:Uncharacterized protein n=1 Tax=Diplodia corticola TaxID=236234 RepID=A0A1J9RF30_9PEZI|nr:uncharacterized protein BKCO1_5100042 [Diplodia corticola]OJD31171.1 hypothetical protein BKCO1_5100042 [Diplodia corticola]